MAHMRNHIKRERAEARAYSQAVIEGGRIVWLAGRARVCGRQVRELTKDFLARIEQGEALTVAEQSNLLAKYYVCTAAATQE